MRNSSGTRLAQGIFWAATLFTFVMAVAPHPPELPGAPSDKIQHIVAFSTLAALAVWAYPRSSKLRLLILLSLFGAAIEVVQALPSLHRDSDIVDWAADTAAAGILLAIFYWGRVTN